MNHEDEHEYDDESDEIHSYDQNSSNVFVRAGYIRAMAHKLPHGEDWKFLRRASKSLLAYGKKLQEEGK